MRARRISSSISAAKSVIALSGSLPSSVTIPASTPSGRSVTLRTTATGTPSDAPSSCRPPESVRIKRLRASSAAMQPYSSGSTSFTFCTPDSGGTTDSRTAGLRWTGNTNVHSARARATSARRRASSFSTGQFSRRCSVTVTTGPRAGTPSGKTPFFEAKRIASTAVCPVTKTCSGAAPLFSRLARAPSVGAKNVSHSASVSTRLASSGNGSLIEPLRSPASTCPTGIRSRNAAHAETNVVSVSPCTST